MESQPKSYQKLPGKKKNFLMGIHRLWLGEDHLLQVHSRLGVEQYQRFYFSDIQSLVTHKTVAGKIYNGLLAAITLILVIPALKLGGGGSLFFYAGAVFFAVILVINWLLGPTCRTYVRTAVQQEALPSLYRLKTAQRVLNWLRPVIQAKQGMVSRGQLMQGLSAGRAKPPQAAAGAKFKPQGSTRTATAFRPRGRVHSLVAVLLAARALFGTGEFFVNHMAITIFDMALFVALAIAAIVFLVRQYDPPRHTGMLTAAWSTITYIGLSAISGYAMFIGMAFRQPNAMYNQWKQIELVAKISPMDNSVLMGLQLFFVVFAAILAVTILLISNSLSTPPPYTGDRSGPTLRPQTDGRV